MLVRAVSCLGEGGAEQKHRYKDYRQTRLPLPVHSSNKNTRSNGMERCRASKSTGTIAAL